MFAVTACNTATKSRLARLECGTRPNRAVPDSLLTILKVIFLGLLYLFFLRVLRAVWTELREPKTAQVAASSSGPAQPEPAQPWKILAPPRGCFGRARPTGGGHPKNVSAAFSFPAVHVRIAPGNAWRLTLRGSGAYLLTTRSRPSSG